MAYRKILFIDRDGTLIEEPADEQIDSLEKLKLVAGVIPNLLRLRDAGFELVMVTNQDGLGSEKYPQTTFDQVQEKMMDLFSSQGISFKEVLICPHFAQDSCLCRKPHLGLVRKYLTDPELDLENSVVIGDRESDLLLAKNMGIQGIRISRNGFDSPNWSEITRQLLQRPRMGKASRKTSETEIDVQLDLDGHSETSIQTGIGYFDHMLEQLAKHSGISLSLRAQGDLHIDEHHTVEDTAWVLGDALKKALSNKFGLQRYGFSLPMDETLARTEVSMDLSGRPYFKFDGSFPRSEIGELPTELVPHFFRTLSDRVGLTLHMQVQGENAHHMVEALFKSFARALRMAISQTEDRSLPSTKGVL